jgi:hypothetical protein
MASMVLLDWTNDQVEKPGQLGRMEVYPTSGRRSLMLQHDLQHGTTTLEPDQHEEPEESLAALSELGAFYPLIAYPAPADDVEPQDAVDSMIMAGLTTGY